MPEPAEVLKSFSGSWWLVRKILYGYALSPWRWWRSVRRRSGRRSISTCRHPSSCTAAGCAACLSASPTLFGRRRERRRARLVEVAGCPVFLGDGLESARPARRRRPRSWGVRTRPTKRHTMAPAGSAPCRQRQQPRVPPPPRPGLAWWSATAQWRLRFPVETVVGGEDSVAGTIAKPSVSELWPPCLFVTPKLAVGPCRRTAVISASPASW